MEPIRILHIVNILTRGGMESRLMDLYRNVNRDAFQFDFYVESGKIGIFDSEIRKLGGRLFYCERNGYINVPNFRNFFFFLKEHDEYKIVYAYNQWAGFYLKVAKTCNVPFRIAYSRTSLQTKSIKNFVKNIAKLNANKYATHRFAVSKKAAVWLFGQRMLDNKKVFVWPNAIDAEKYAFSDDIRKEVRKELGLSDEYTIIHVGNIRPEKNHLFLLRVFYEIKKRIPNSILVLVGGGEFKCISKTMRSLGIEQSVLNLGVRDDVYRLLQAADAFVFPSFYEGFPGAVLEAQASGLNCLISDSITKEVLISDCVQAESLYEGPARWAETIVGMNGCDRKEAWKYIKEAGYDISSLIRKTELFYEDLAH